MRKKNRATVADPCVAVPDDTDQALLIEEDAKRLHQAMEQLNADHKLVLHMKYFEELSVKTIAETLELPEGTVKTRLRRARELVGTYYGRKVRVSG
jgi:RNA polymerase sigma-70 factor (ECF subfamily)